MKFVARESKRQFTSNIEHSFFNSRGGYIILLFKSFKSSINNNKSILTTISKRYIMSKLVLQTLQKQYRLLNYQHIARKITNLRNAPYVISHLIQIGLSFCDSHFWLAAWNSFRRVQTNLQKTVYQLEVRKRQQKQRYCGFQHVASSLMENTQQLQK